MMRRDNNDLHDTYSKSHFAFELLPLCSSDVFLFFSDAFPVSSVILNEHSRLPIFSRFLATFFLEETLLDRIALEPSLMN